MITTINEFFFSDHYMYDKDNRFHQRIKNAQLVNTNIDNLEKAQTRLKRALYWYGLEKLDKLSIVENPVVVIFGNIYIREDKRLKLAEIKIESGIVGNVYCAIIKDKTVVTITLLPATYTNKEILDKAIAHDDSNFRSVYSIETGKLELSDKKRNNIIIDLDISDDEFFNQFPAPILKNNRYNSSIISEIDMIEIEKEKKKREEKKTERSLIIIPDEYKQLVPLKEYVIYDGMKILVNYPIGVKEKTIRKLVIDETGDSRKFSLEFENTLKPLELNIDDNFIITPKLQNDELMALYKVFDLEPGEPISFQGKIQKFNFYSKQKTGTIPKLGIIIKPTMYF